jgi:predicted  nucleic acid-binding Zn-ribbon protein
MTVTALLSAYNEGDIIGPVVQALVEGGIRVYVLDHGSSDDTVDRVRPFVDRGVIAIEPLARETDDEGRVCWASVLRRKQELAGELDSDWFIHHDADEFHESPWSGLGLREAIERVDRAGYTAIDYEPLHFWPTHDQLEPGSDPRGVFVHYETARAWDRPQIHCWKRGGPPVDLVSSGGHEARFIGRRVFPVRFVLRHYPIRSQAHGERKVFRERLAQLSSEERERGWHRQYEGLVEGESFLRDPATLQRFEPEAVRLALTLRHRGVEELESSPEVAARQRSDAEWERDAVARDLDARSRDLEQLNLDLDKRNHEIERLHSDLNERNRELERLGRELDGRNLELEQMSGEGEGLTRELERVSSDLDERNRELERARGDLDERNRELEQVVRNRELERVHVSLDERNRELARLQTDLDAGSREWERARAELDERKYELERAQEQLGNRSQEVETTRRELELRERDITALGSALESSTGGMGELRVEMERLQREVELLRGAHTSLSNRNEALSLQVGEREVELGELDARRAELEVRLHEIESSLIWRWTRPLRALGPRLRKARS